MSPNFARIACFHASGSVFGSGSDVFEGCRKLSLSFCTCFSCPTRPDSLEKLSESRAHSLSSRAILPRSLESASASLVASPFSCAHLRLADIAVNAKAAATTANARESIQFITHPTVFA